MTRTGNWRPSWPVEKESEQVGKIDHAALQLLLRSWELFKHLRDTLLVEMDNEELQSIEHIEEGIATYFSFHGWYLGYDDFRGAALCTRPYPHPSEQVKE